MNKTFTQWMQENKYPESQGGNAKSLKLADGTTLSIQASRFHYCQPRANFEDYALYSEFEIGFPSVEIPEIMKWAENPEDPTNTVYGYVPKAVIEKVISSRGGVVGCHSWGE